MILTIRPQFNTEGRRDASGAFIPQARAFLRANQVPVVSDWELSFDNTATMARRMEVLKRNLARPRPSFHTAAFFCHGWKDGIQAGYRTKDVAELAETLAAASGSRLKRVVLYACDTGRDNDSLREDDLRDVIGGDGGFADSLRDAFRRRGDAVTVYAHSKEGHCTQCPYVRVFEGDSDEKGGHFLVAPTERLWPVWRRALAGTDLWARFPFMSREEVIQELGEVPNA